MLNENLLLIMFYNSFGGGAHPHYGNVIAALSNQTFKWKEASDRMLQEDRARKATNASIAKSGGHENALYTRSRSSGSLSSSPWREKYNNGLRQLGIPSPWSRGDGRLTGVERTAYDKC